MFAAQDFGYRCGSSGKQGRPVLCFHSLMILLPTPLVEDIVAHERMRLAEPRHAAGRASDAVLRNEEAVPGREGENGGRVRWASAVDCSRMIREGSLRRWSNFLRFS